MHCPDRAHITRAAHIYLVIIDIPRVILAEDIKPYIDHIVHIGDLCTGRFHTIHRSIQDES